MRSRDDLEAELAGLRFVSRADIAEIGHLWAGGLLASILPVRLDSRLVPAWLGLRALVPVRTPSATERLIRAALAPVAPDVDITAVTRDFKAMTRETRWLVVRAAGSARLAVETSVSGLEHARRAATGGVVLWGMSFCGPLVVKVGLSRAGVDLVHLSGVGHGAPVPLTRMGIRLVGRHYETAENRFLAERIVIPLDGSLGYMRRLIERLSQNRVVYMAGDRTAPRRNTKVTFLGREMRLARGAPGLAFRSGSALLPVHVVRESPLRYTVVIHEPLEATRSEGKERFISEAVQAYARLLENCVLKNPEGWDWYRYPSLATRAGDLAPAEPSGG